MKLFLLMAAVLAAPLVLAHGEKKAHIDYSNAEETPFGIAADPRKAKRTVRVDMHDTMRFSPLELKVKRGETVRFLVANKGKVLHELVLGRKEDLERHAELMRKFPGMEHDEPHMAHVSPGKSGEIGWRFTEPGIYYYGCLIAGHFEAGMVGRIEVTQ